MTTYRPGEHTMRVFLVVNEPESYEYLIPRLNATKVVITDWSLSGTHPVLRKGVFRGLRQLRDSLKVGRLALKEKHGSVFVCQSSHYSVLIGAAAARLFGRRARVYLFNFFVNRAIRGPLARPFMKALLRTGVGMFVNSRNEVDFFKAFSRTVRVDYYPYCLGDITGISWDPDVFDDVVFTGGHTNRDYDLFLRVARSFPSLRFVAACSKATTFRERVPDNVTVIRDLESQDFHRHMARARIVVVPLVSELGSSGQMVALAAMQFARVIVYADSPGLSQYFVNGESGFAYTIGDRASLQSALESALAAAVVPSAAGRNARTRVETLFSRASHDEALARRIEEFRDATEAVSSAPPA